MKKRTYEFEIETINTILKRENTVYLCKTSKQENCFLVAFRTSQGYWNAVEFYNTDNIDGNRLVHVLHIEMVLNPKSVKFALLWFGCVSKAHQVYEIFDNDCLIRESDYNAIAHHFKPKNCINIIKSIKITNQMEKKSLLHLLEQVSIEY